MPITDLFDRAEGYGHDQGVQDTKDDGDWDTLPTLPDAEERLESTSDRLFRSVDAKHAYEGPDDYDADPFLGDTPFDEHRRYVHAEWDEGGHALVMNEDGTRPELTYVGDNPRLDEESTEAAVYNRPVLGYDHDPDGGVQAQGDGLMDAAEHVGYRDADGNFVVELDDPNNFDETADPKPARADLYDTDAAAPQPPPDDELTTEQDLVDDYGANLDPPA